MNKHLFVSLSTLFQTNKLDFANKRSCSLCLPLRVDGFTEIPRSPVQTENAEGKSPGATCGLMVYNLLVLFFFLIVVF